MHCALQLLGAGKTLPQSTMTVSKMPFLSQVYVTHHSAGKAHQGRLDFTLGWLANYSVTPAVIYDYSPESECRGCPCPWPHRVNVACGMPCA